MSRIRTRRDYKYLSCFTQSSVVATKYQINITSRTTDIMSALKPGMPFANTTIAVFLALAIWMILSNASRGKCLISPVALSREAVLMALPLPAQLINILS